MQKLFITLLVLFLCSSCSNNLTEDIDLINNVEKESLIDDFDESTRSRGANNYGITKLRDIKRLNPSFSPGHIVSKSPEYKITTYRYQLKDLFGNVLKEEKESVPLYQTEQFHRNNFSLSIRKFYTANGTFGPNEQAFLRNAFVRFRKMYAHPHFITFLNNAGITRPGGVVYNKIRTNVKGIAFQRKKGIKAMKANGTKISVSNQIKFTGGVKPLGKLSHELGHVYGYGHGTNVNAAMERYVKIFYMDGEKSNYNLQNLNRFKYEFIKEVDAPLHNTWVLFKFRKKNKLKTYNNNLETHPFLQFDLIDGNRGFSGSNGNVAINGQVEDLTYEKFNISTVETSDSTTHPLSKLINKALKQVVSYTVKNDNTLILRNKKGKAVLVYTL